MRLIDNIKNWDEGDWFGGLLCTMLLGAVLTAGVVGITALRSDGKVDFCYTQFVNSQGVPHSDGYLVKGHIPWRTDVTLGNADTPEKAQELLQQTCPTR